MSETPVKIKNPSRELSIKVGDNTYTIKYPNTGQMLQIESMKVSMTRDSYNSFVAGDTVAAQIARYTTDMIAFLSTCCLQLKADLKVETFSELEALENKKLLKIYISSILPWLQEWEVLLNSDDEEESKEEEVK